MTAQSMGMCACRGGREQGQMEVRTKHWAFVHMHPSTATASAKRAGARAARQETHAQAMEEEKERGETFGCITTRIATPQNSICSATVADSALGFISGLRRYRCSSAYPATFKVAIPESSFFVAVGGGGSLGLGSEDGAGRTQNSE